MQEEGFKKALRALEEAFVQEGRAGETDEEKGRALLDFILKRERLRHRVAEDAPLCEAVDRATLRRLTDSVELGPEHSIAEAALRRLSRDPAGAVAYLTQHVDARSAAQSRRSKKREDTRDELSRLIGRIVQEDPRIPAKVVLKKLLELRGPDTVIVLDGEIRHVDSATTISERRFPGRVSEAKKRLTMKNSGQPG